jgi:hypothetical protein
MQLSRAGLPTKLPGCRFHAQALATPRLHLRASRPDNTVPAGALGLIHPLVGELQHQVRPLRLVAHGEADADLDGKTGLDALQVRILDRTAQALANVVDRGRMVAMDQQREFLAAEARQQIIGSPASR